MSGLGSPERKEAPFECEDDWVGVAWRPDVPNPPKSLREENNELKNQKAKLEVRVREGRLVARPLSLSLFPRRHEDKHA